MSKNLLERLSGLAGSLLVATFVLGLAEGISSGFAGFWGGFPFWVISLAVLSLTFYDLGDSCFRRKTKGNGDAGDSA